MLASFGGGYGDMIAACVVALQADSERAESREKAHERVNEWCCNEGFSRGDTHLMKSGAFVMTCSNSANDSDWSLSRSASL